jgi:hypothetical protein
LEKTREEAAGLLAGALGETTLLVFPQDLVGELVTILRNIKERPYLSGPATYHHD